MSCRVIPCPLSLLLGLVLAGPGPGQDPTDLAGGLGRLPAELLRGKKTDGEIVDALFRAALSRPPSREETARICKHLQTAGDRELACREVVWALVNTKEFVRLRGLDFNQLQRLNDRLQEVWKKR